MKVECTWEDCPNGGEFKQIATDGEVWAILCKDHNRFMDDGLTGPEFSPKQVMSNWIKAQGGAKKAAKRMMK